jgi:hypothetical protein
MTHSRYLRNMARLLRVEQQLTVDQLAGRLAVPRSTVYYWVRDLPLRTARAESAEVAEGAEPGDAGGTAGEREHLSPGQASAYEQGLRSFDDLVAQPTFRDFLCIYILEGYKRDRSRVSLTNADPAVMRLVNRWIWRLTDKSPSLSVRCPPEQSISELRRFWSETVGAQPEAIRARSGKEGEPVQRSSTPTLHGALTVSVEDKLLRARLQAWMCKMREDWR